jgi:hypothetical protein
MAVTVVPQLPWCSPAALPYATISQHAARQALAFNLETIITININWSTNCTRIDNNDGVADDDACSHVWGVSGSSDAISCPMDLLALLGGLVLAVALRKAVGTWATWWGFGGINTAICCISGHPEWDLVPPGRRH